MGRQAPIVKKTPIPLRDTSLAQASGKKVAACGYQFEIPWSDLDDSKTKSFPASKLMFFHSGVVLMFKCIPPRNFVNGLQSSTNTTPENIRQAFGDDALQSDYAFTRLMLETTPDKITLRTSREDAIKTSLMLLIKGIATPNAESGIFSIHTAEFEGFQYEDPQMHPKSVVADLFAPDQTLEFMFFLNFAGTSPHVSQADINLVLQTIRREPSSESLQ